MEQHRHPWMVMLVVVFYFGFISNLTKHIPNNLTLHIYFNFTILQIIISINLEIIIHFVFGKWAPRNNGPLVRRIMRQRIFKISLYFRLFSVGIGIASTTRSVCCLSVPSPGLRRKFWPAYSYAIHGLTVMFYKCENHRMANTRNWKNTKKRFDVNRGCGVKMF